MATSKSLKIKKPLFPQKQQTQAQAPQAAGQNPAPAAPAYTPEQIRAYANRLQTARTRILCKNGFFGLLLMHMNFALDPTCPTAATDANKIYFGPAFMDDLSDSELDFILMHEVMHVALKHCFRDGDRDSFQFNVACDIVVNSNVMHACGDDVRVITLRKYGESMHKTPAGDEGWQYTAEEVYEMLAKNSQKMPQNGGGMDDHSRWGKDAGQNGAAQGGQSELAQDWMQRVVDAVTTMQVRDPSNTRGLVPMGVQRIFDEFTNPQTDWRTVLNDFVQQDVTDYSFTPPDRRFTDSPFFLPDFNETEDSVRDVLFMVDTSGSISDKMLQDAYSEIKGAIDQYDGKLTGKLGFFDAAVTPAVPFADVGELKRIKPVGGGGTDFGIIFDYVRDNMAADPPCCIVVITDGYAAFPDQSAANGIPVLWLLTNELVAPPWGKIARIKA